MLAGSFCCVERRREMGLFGTFDDLGFGEVLQLLNLGRKSGMLVVRQGRQEAIVHLRDGQVVDASADDARGAEVIYRLLGWRDGEFEFTRSVKPVTRTIHESTESLVLEGMKRIDEWQNIEQEFSDMNVVLRIKGSDAAERFEALNPEARKILRLVDARRDVAGIIRESGIEPVQAIMTITELIAQEIVERWESEPVSTFDPVARVKRGEPASAETPARPEKPAKLGVGSYFSARPPRAQAGEDE
jgi:hypothetical protein